MEEQMEMLREELNQLTKKDAHLYSDEVVKLSQKLDKLIAIYYKDIMSV